VGWRLPRWLPGRRLYGGINRCFFALAAPRIGPDIYHATYYKVLAPRLRTRRVFTVYDMIHELHPGPLAARDPTPRRKQQAVQRADHLVCISRHTRDDLIRLLGVAAGKTTVTHLAGSLRATPRAGRPHPQPYLLYVGDRDGYKNADLVGRTLASQPDLRPQFHLVFFGGPPFTRAEQQRLTDLGLGGQTHRVTGSDEDLATWYAHAFALVYPSHYEGFGIPPLEAMQYGCPVLASDRSSLPEVVGEAARLFDPDSETSLADALRGLVDNPAERADLLCKGQQHHQWFTWKACADRTQSVYASLMPPPAHHE
jgi:glycosyltransferase involved in cell wall biosynthesis